MSKHATPPKRLKAKSLKSKKKRTQSSRAWLQRQLNDVFVFEAQKQGYRSRAAFKLLQIQEKTKFIQPTFDIIDLGAAPGGWSQVLRDVLHHKGQLIAVDLLDMEPIQDVSFIKGDFLDKNVQAQIFTLLGGKKADIILSDMAPNTTGHADTDFLRIEHLLEHILIFAEACLKQGGCILVKLFQGGGSDLLQKELKTLFRTVKNIKPEASRKESKEMYVIACGYRH